MSIGMFPNDVWSLDTFIGADDKYKNTLISDIQWVHWQKKVKQKKK